MPIGTTQFPTSLDTSSSLVEVADNALTTLDGALDNSATTITVVSTSLFPSTGILTIDNEKISYTGKTATTFTGCTRGVGGTSAASHLTAANVEILIVEEWHRVHSAAIIAIETKLGTGSAIAVNKLEALTASRLPVLDASGFLSASSVTATEAGYLSGVTSAIQTQLGNKQGLDATLTALAAYNTNGLLTQTAADTFTGRTLTGTSNRISVSNGDGVSGNPTVDISTSYVGQATITTLGTITTGTWNGSAIAAAYIGDLSAVYQPLDADLTAIAALSANGFLKKTAGTWGMDSSTYLTANQTITLSGDVSGSGTVAITCTIASLALSKLAALTASRALVSDGSGVVSVSSVTSTELGYLASVTSAIQTQLDAKAVKALSNLASVSINASLIPQTTLDLGAAATAWRDLYLYGSGTFGSHSIKLTGTPTGNRTLTLPDATDTVSVLGTAQTHTAAKTFAANAIFGAAGGTTGQIQFKGTTSGTVTMKVADAAGTYTLTLPTDDGTSGQVLLTDGSGVLSWSSYVGIPAVVVLTDAATIAVNAALRGPFRVTLGGNRTLGNPSNAVDGQIMTFEIIQDGTGSRTLSLDTKYAFGTDITGVTLTTTASKRDFLTVEYNSTADKFYVIAFTKGY